MRTIFLTSIFLVICIAPSANSTQACPFDEAGIEVTIMAHNEISEAVENNDFNEATKKIISYKYLFEYFEIASKKPLYQPILDAGISKNKQELIRLLDHSLVLEVDELLVQVDEMFGQYQPTRLRIVKAKKHLEALTSAKEPMKVMKKILKSIGNPGLMGVGQREANKKEFLENKDILMGLISSSQEPT